jgi:hypothetical protein
MGPQPRTLVGSACVHDHGDADQADGGAEQIGAVWAEAVEGDAPEQ